MADELHEGLMKITLRNKSVTGKPYVLNNFIGNIKVGVEQLENVSSMLDFTHTSVKARRDPDNHDVIIFDLWVKGVMIGPLPEE